MVHRTDFSFYLLIAVSALTSAVAGFSVNQEEVTLGFDNVFVPKGFDSNDSVEIVVSGDLPNTCYLRPHGEVKIINDTIRVEMKATKITNPKVFCIEALVPYVASVSLGQLHEGHYDIFVNQGTASEKDSGILVEHPNSNSINNFTYANVTSAEAMVGSRELVITGTHPSSCMEIERVEIIPNENNDTFSVLPIIKQTQDICDRSIKPFSYTLKLPEAQKNHELVHIRKIDGTALNYLVKVPSKHDQMPMVR